MARCSWRGIVSAPCWLVPGRGISCRKPHQWSGMKVDSMEIGGVLFGCFLSNSEGANQIRENMSQWITLDWGQVRFGFWLICTRLSHYSQGQLFSPQGTIHIGSPLKARDPIVVRVKKLSKRDCVALLDRGWLKVWHFFDVVCDWPPNVGVNAFDAAECIVICYKSGAASLGRFMGDQWHRMRSPLHSRKPSFEPDGLP